MKKILLVSALIGSLCSSLAYGEKPLLSIEFWITATLEDVNHAVAKGADVKAHDENGFTVLAMAACANTNPIVVARVVQLGADVNARSEHGWTALMMAAEINMNPEVIEQLVRLGADVHARDGLLGRPILMFAAQSNPNPDVIERLVKLGADVNARDKYQGRTALMWAARFTSNPEVIERLLKLGADVSYKNECGHSALGLVKENKQLKGAKAKAYQMLKDAANDNK